MHSMAHDRSDDYRPSRGSRNAAALAKCTTGSGNSGTRDFTVPGFPPLKTSSKARTSPKGKAIRSRRGDGKDSDQESVGSCPSPAREHANAESNNHSPQRSPPRSPRRSTRVRSQEVSLRNGQDSPRSKTRGSPRIRSSNAMHDNNAVQSNTNPTNGGGSKVRGSVDSEGQSSPARRKSPTHPKVTINGDSSSSKPQDAVCDDGDGGGCDSDYDEVNSPNLQVDIPYPAKWRTFGRRPPAIHEYRPMGDMRTRNVRPAGKQSYLMRRADEKRGCDSQIYEGDLWDDAYGLAKPVTDKWTSTLMYGATRVIRTGDIDPWFIPSRGDLIIINPAQNYYRAMKSGYVMSLRVKYMFGVGDLILRVGTFLPSGKYVPYGNLELYMYTPCRDWRFLGRQPYLLVDFNYHNLDYESPGKYLAIGTFLVESFTPRRGDIIIRGGSWAENYPNKHRRHHSSVKYWKPHMEFLPNDMLLRPYVDVGRCEKTREFYWGAAELYSYSGKGLAWAYWGRDHHVCDTPFPVADGEPIKTGHHKDETGHYGTDHFQHGAKTEGPN